jgi:hypothetical protein
MVCFAQQLTPAFGLSLRLVQKAPVERQLSLPLFRLHPPDRLGGGGESHEPCNRDHGGDNRNSRSQSWKTV